MDIIMAAAENAALKGAKAGGLADVVAEVGPELQKMGCPVTTIIPSYGFVHRLNPSRYLFSVPFHFGGERHQADFHEVTPGKNWESVRHLVIDHPLFNISADSSEENPIYCNDPSDRPFATDATRFALFSSALAAGLVQNRLKKPDCIHLHDWHTAFLLILRKYHPDFQWLRSIRTVYTIHNLALQGTRCFYGSDSSMTAWFPGLAYDPADLSDPRWGDCVNPMAAGIRLSDAVHTVSPSYAEEILQPVCKPDFCSGGEGLEADLRQARENNRLIGILNGCAYPEDRNPPKADFKTICGVLKSVVLKWLSGRTFPPTFHYLAETRISDFERMNFRPSVLLTSVSRLTDQKMLLMRTPCSTGRPVLEEILTLLQEEGGIYILLGSGDPDYEDYFRDTASRFNTFLFLRGYSDPCAETLYANGDLFLMPSSFEPCGISQMLAMRDGQPCVAHRVGGLKDTVKDQYNGFAFMGEGVARQADGFLAAIRLALQIRKENPEQWERICRQAAAERFSWEKSASLYIKKLYNPEGSE